MLYRYMFTFVTYINNQLHIENDYFVTKQRLLPTDTEQFKLSYNKKLQFQFGKLNVGNSTVTFIYEFQPVEPTY